MSQIMIVDDALFMRRMLRDILVAEGYEICAEAASAIEAVDKYRKYKPDLVTMDIVMPKMEELDGIGAIREILRIDHNARILICSVLSQQPLLLEALDAGAKDFVTKPVKPDLLIEAVKNILK